MSDEPIVQFDDEDVFDDIETDPILTPNEKAHLIADLKARCGGADIGFVEEIDEDGDAYYKIEYKSGRKKRSFVYFDDNQLKTLSSVPFEKYIFLDDLVAICSYEDRTIEAGLVLAASDSRASQVYRRMFGINYSSPKNNGVLLARSGSEGDTEIEISRPSHLYRVITKNSRSSFITLKIRNLNVHGHDAVVDYLKKAAGSILFQLDLVSDVALILMRARARVRPRKRVGVEIPDLKFPDTEYDNSPLTLYWYARSAKEMPLLQFLAFYQVVEFYFPIYSKSEAIRKLKKVLRNPGFRADRDADVARLLTATATSRAGALGDERSQLKATLTECVEQDDLREFLKENQERCTFLSEKNKTGYSKLSIASADSDLLNEVVSRVYEIRCAIVHSKVDARDGDVDLLLPNSKEAEQLQYDIQLIHYLAQQVLIAAGRPFVGG